MSDVTPEPAASPEVAGPQSEQAPATGPSARPRSVRQSLGSIVLGFEIIIVFLAALVVWGLAPTENGTWGLPPWTALAAGGALILLLIATIGLLRHDWAVWLGWGIQALIIVAGLINPALYVVGALFGGLWAYCMVVGGRIDRERAATAEPGKEPQ